MGVSSFGESHLLAERRLLSSLHPFAVQVEARMQYWRGLVDSGWVSWDRLEDATQELVITALGFEALADTAVAEDWSRAEFRLLTRVYKDIAGPYHEAWTALLTTWVKNAADTQGAQRLRVVADKAMRRVEEAEKVVSAAA